ncbi:uncharacterized protein LOC123910893 [Trifolium pratense]|uniref:uncharacterized protein LOC123910893 n=1 Tax=Trifolium pratense TaxID=57577 RepID=UPI001E690068|nr:uncharacterized protein LOC123910893 [Trifolium pratense]
MTSSSSSTKVTLKLLVDTKENKVLFAEASKAAIDNLLNMFRLSFGNVVRFMSNDDVHLLGSLGSLYHTSSTVQNLNHNRGNSFYMCPNGCIFGISCDHCSRVMNHDETRCVAIKDQNVTFILMDDLVIKPFSPISIITLLNKFNFKQVGTLQEMVVEFGMDECVELLKTSLQSKMVLTSVFIKNKNKKDFTIFTVRMLSVLKIMGYLVFSFIGYLVDCSTSSPLQDKDFGNVLLLRNSFHKLRNLKPSPCAVIFVFLFEM